MHAQPFSNIQLELLKLYATNVPDADLLEIKRYLSRFFMKKAISEADKIWEERGYTPELMSQILEGKND